mmetsp:Transcript_107854/g.190774  ORF Transcript_107854/g.190774 Transcript_107854/m.190774 type:complete len:112 (-) Transcript_107854:709-1044(-)
MLTGSMSAFVVGVSGGAAPSGRAASGNAKGSATKAVGGGQPAEGAVERGEAPRVPAMGIENGAEEGEVDTKEFMGDANNCCGDGERGDKWLATGGVSVVGCPPVPASENRL